MRLDKTRAFVATGESPDGQPRSPVGPLVAFAAAEGHNLKSGAHQGIPRLLLLDLG